MRIVLLFVFVAVLLGGAGLVGFIFISSQRLRELAIKERIALIEKGLIPSPEVDPVRFETLVGLRRPVSPKAAHYRSTGVLTMGLGAALMVLLAFAGGVPGIGVGLGGSLIILGVAAFINGMLLSGDDPGPGASTRT